ncbi:hypothetical protein ACJIZ3_014178 [Penstemon smallii]|uniref:Uncharacterized protein n=1 Tax=Penstemon smallii TaxID=265156 RepID=A0ABD3RUE9_9LAMI
MNMSTYERKKDKIQGMHSDVSSLEKASIWREASRIVRQEGIRAFWKGNLMLQEYLGVQGQGHNLSADLCIRLIGGGLAGITAASVTYPLDLVRTRLAAQFLYLFNGIDLTVLRLKKMYWNFGEMMELEMNMGKRFSLAKARRF